MLHLLCHSVNLISPVVISCMCWPKFNAKFGSIFGNMFQMGTLSVLHLLYANKTMLNIYQCVIYLGLFCITDPKYWISYVIFTMLAYGMSNI